VTGQDGFHGTCCAEKLLKEKETLESREIAVTAGKNMKKGNVSV